MRQMIALFLILISQTTIANTIVTKKTDLSSINNQIQSLKKTIQQDQQLQTNLQLQLKTTEITLGKINFDMRQLTQDLNQEQTVLINLKTSQQKSSTDLKMQQDVLAQQIRAAYRLGTIQPWKIVLNQQDLNSAGRHLMYYRYINQSRVELINTINNTLAALNKTIQATQQHQRALQRLVFAKRAQQKQLQATSDTRQRLISRLSQQTQSKQQQMETLLANQKALQETIAQLQSQEVTLSGKSFQALRGKLNWPVKGPLIAQFGSPLDVGNQKLLGALIMAPAGTPVHAIYSGKVLFANWLRGFGLLVIINHGDNYMSLYGRNSAIYAKAGSYVQTGDIIAATGNTGGYDKPSLYFEVRQNGTPINPSTWCR